MIIKQPVWVSFESQRICSLGRMKELFTMRDRVPLGRVPCMKHEEAWKPWDHRFIRKFCWKVSWKNLRG